MRDSARSNTPGDPTSMTTVNDTIAFTLKTSQMMLQRLVMDLAPQEYLHRPTPKANCAAWLLGHLVLTERSALRRVGAPLPEIPAGFEQRFSRDAGCPEAAEFGDVSGLLATFIEHRDRLIAAIKAASAMVLNIGLGFSRRLSSISAGAALIAA